MAAQLLSEVLAGVVGLGSVTLYLAAFFFPEVHRRHDFFWSGVGCFYALILWLDAGQITPTELVGHLASLSLMGWLGWQTLTLRRKRTPISLQTPYTQDSWPTFRREMTALALDALRQTPLRRWLPQPASETALERGIRVSALKDVGYEFVDSVEPPDTMAAPKRLSPPVVVEQGPTSQPKPTLDGVASPSAVTSETAKSSVAKSPVVKAPVTKSPVTKSPVAKPPDTKPPVTTQPSGKRSPVAVSSSSKAKGMTWGQRAQGLATWVQGLVQAKTSPKPKKPVIEIPPRPSSLAKRSPSPAPSAPGSTVLSQPRPSGNSPEPSDPADSVLDIPEPLEVSPSAPPPNSSRNSAPTDNRDAAPGEPTPSATPTPLAQSAPEESNWDDDDEDWV